jgi:hypothetical protein
MRATLEHDDVEIGVAGLQLQPERQPGEAAAGDDDVMSRAHRTLRAARSGMSAWERPGALMPRP